MPKFPGTLIISRVKRHYTVLKSQVNARVTGRFDVVVHDNAGSAQYGQVTGNRFLLAPKEARELGYTRVRPLADGVEQLHAPF